MTTTEKFDKLRSEMSDLELISLAEKQVQELSKTYGKSYRMSLPPRVSDTDMILCELIKRFKDAADFYYCYRDKNDESQNVKTDRGAASILLGNAMTKLNKVNAFINEFKEM